MQLNKENTDMNTKDKVFYSDFGAVGDGIADDFSAIKAAHDYANEKKIPVFADKGATYYINKTGGALIYIMTDTDWTDASFTIDDRNIVDDDVERRAGIFVVKADYSAITVTAEDDTPAGAAIRAINASKLKVIISHISNLSYQRHNLPSM